jgi:hypothetical protein
MSQKSSTKPRPVLVRCAIYTRKSSEEGLNQEFNSLDAQREAGEAYIASQQHEGWGCLPEAILAGEPPFDLFVRWKPLAEQPIGWEPDINDGVLMNIRPFLASDLPGGRTGAGILRWRPNIKWTQYRGKEPDRPKAEYPWFWNWDEKTQDFLVSGKEPDGNRWNDCHYSNTVKQAARDTAKKGGN